MKFSYRNAEGGIAIVVGAPRGHIERMLKREISDEEYHAEAIKGIPEDATEVQQLPDDWQPIEDRTFRNAWEINGKGVNVHMGRARDIQRDVIRAERAAEFARLDVEGIRAIERDDRAAAADVARRKQKLRDAPAHPSIEAAATPEELKAITLDQVSK